MHNGVPDINMLDAATFHNRVQRLIRDAETDRVQVGEVTITMDTLGLNVYLGPAMDHCYNWQCLGDGVQVTFRCRLVKRAHEALDRAMVLDALADV